MDGRSIDAARFDERSLVSCAGLVPVLSLAEQTGLGPLLGRVGFRASKVRAGAVNPAGKLVCVIAGMTAGADCIDELEVIRSGGMTTLFDGVYAPSTLGILLREFRLRSHQTTRLGGPGAPGCLYGAKSRHS